VPLIWALMCSQEWGLPKEATIRIWEAFAQSEYSIPSGFRQWLLYQPYAEIGAFQRVYSPHAVVVVLRELVAEQRITFAEANNVIEGMLSKVNSEGLWKA